MGFLGVTPLSGYFEERRGYRGGKELLSEKSAVPPLIEYMLANTIERDARNDGWKAGIAQGIAEGSARGSRQKALEIAQILKQFGDSVQKIMQVTGLSKEDVENA